MYGDKTNSMIKDIKIEQILKLADLPTELIEVLRSRNDIQITSSVVKRQIIIAIYERRMHGLSSLSNADELGMQIDELLKKLKTTLDEEIHLALIKTNQKYFILFFDKSIEKVLGMLDVSENEK